jgi:hypothetical protein
MLFIAVPAFYCQHMYGQGGHRLVPLSELSGKSSKMLFGRRVRVTVRRAGPPWYLNSPPPSFARPGCVVLSPSPANGLKTVAPARTYSPFLELKVDAFNRVVGRDLASSRV